MAETKIVPSAFSRLLARGCINDSDVVKTDDGFIAVFKSLSDILAVEGIKQFRGSKGEILFCDRFFDDWYIYAVPYGKEYVYSLFKLREQEFDAEEGIPADGDTPGVTVSFVSFSTEVLFSCIEFSSDDNRKKLSAEINRVVAFRGQRHHEALKRYFLNPEAEGAYLIASLYVKHIASYARDGFVDVPICYKKLEKASREQGASDKIKRLPQFIDCLNKKAGTVVCDHNRIRIVNSTCPNEFECAAILATHTANVSIHSFAAEVEYHAKFLLPIARIRIPFLGKSVYESAIRADMTIDDNEFEGPAPFYRLDSKLVKRHIKLHKEHKFLL